MTITLFEHRAHALQVIRLDGVLSRSELVALGALHSKHLDWARSDAIHLIDEALDVSQLDYVLLDELREHYRTVHGQLDFHLVRRSAWVCPSPQAWPFLEYWLADRHSRDGQGTDVCLVATLGQADLLFDVEELEAVAAWEGFFELHRLEAP